MRILLIALLGLLSHAWAGNVALNAPTRYLEATSAVDPTVLFRQWVKKFNRRYNLAEYERRLSVFIDNLSYILKENAKGKSYTLGLNRFADLTQYEYASNYLGRSPEDKASSFRRLDKNRLKSANAFRYSALDESVLVPTVDWRQHGAVSEVKNQGQCGSCWSFSTTGAVEGVVALSTGKLISLSEQELIDCDLDNEYGCQGGLMDYAFEWIIENGGLDTERDWEYLAEQQACNATKRDSNKLGSIDGYEDVPENDESSLKKAAANQPVSVAIQANVRSFQLYTSGIYDDDECAEDLDHGVLLVGYGEKVKQSGKRIGYWIVKNSWGPEWGNEGYIYLRMGRGDDGAGMCGIAMAPSYPTRKDQPQPGPGPQPGPEPGPDPGPEPGPEPAPSPPTPKPVMCDLIHQCPEDSTCCCTTQLPIGNVCWEWSCCPLDNAVCCDDKEHCCPSDLPICDLETLTCRSDVDPGTPVYGMRTAPMSSKARATRRFSRKNYGV